MECFRAQSLGIRVEGSSARKPPAQTPGPVLNNLWLLPVAPLVVALDILKLDVWVWGWSVSGLGSH